MKCVPTAVCGLMMMLPLTAGSLYAQSTTNHGSTTPKASAPGSASQSSPASSASPSTGHAAGGPSSPALADPNAPPPPAHPITAEQTKEILDLMAYKKMEDSAWSQLVTNNRQQAPFIPEDVWTDVQSGLTGIDYVSIIQPIYAKYLSTEDAAKALEFYRTPAGKHVLQAMPPILGESVAVSQQKGRQVGRDAIEKHRAEIEVAQKKYQAEHAPAGGPPTLGPGASSESADPRPGSSSPSSGGASTTPGSSTGGSTAKPNSPSSTPAPGKPSSPSATPPPPQR